MSEYSEWARGAADFVGFHLWLSQSSGGPGLPMTSKIIKDCAVPGYLPDPSLMRGWRTCVRIAMLPRREQYEGELAGDSA
jgi:hypothetical protein